MERALIGKNKRGDEPLDSREDDSDSIDMHSHNDEECKNNRHDMLNVEEDDSSNDDCDSDESDATREVDNRSFCEKLEDGMDEVVVSVQDFLYGERKSFTEDIPATMLDSDNEIRHIDKVQTRRNFNKKFGYKFLKVFFIIGGVVVAFSLLGALLAKLLL